MKNICLYFQVHQPFRLNNFSFMDIGAGLPYFNETLNSEILRQVSLNCYLPANRMLLKLIKESNRRLRVNFSVSGTALDQFEMYMPELTESFRALSATGCVEFMAETYSRSFASLKSNEEFNSQVKAHADKVAALFGKTTRVFRNTTLIHNNRIAGMAAGMGLQALLTEDASQHHKIINLFTDYETFGKFREHSHVLAGFASSLPDEALHQNNHVLSPTAVAAMLPEIASPVRPQAIPHTGDLWPWLGNDMQQDAFDTLYALERKIRATRNEQLMLDWLYLQSADHLYYMSIDEAGNRVSPYNNPFDAFINYMNILTDLSLRADNCLETKKMTDNGRYTLEAGLHL